MGNISILNCIIFCFSVLSVHCQFLINQDVQDRITSESLPLILKFLNDDVGAIINYNSGKIRHTRLKGDILEVDITASLTCRSPSEQCNYESADCRGLLFIKPNKQLQVISVDCNPNLPIEEPIALPIQDVHCEGCLFDMNQNAKGVEELAKNVIQHIESEKGRKYILIKIVKIQQQVTNGVNFVLTVLIGRPPHLCNPNVQECIRDSKDDMYCAVKFFQEPGYQAPKNIISNNCTQTQTFIPVLPEHQSNEINRVDGGKDRYEEKYFHPKKSEQSENNILKELDAQIIPSDEFEFESTKKEELLQPDQVKNMETSANNLLDESSQSNIASSTFQEVLATEDHPISIGTDMAINQDENEDSSSLTDTKLSSTAEPLQEMVLHQLDSNVRDNIQPSDLKEMYSAKDNNSETYRRRRSLVGGKKEVDVDNPNIKEYAEKGINLLNTKLSRGDSLFRISKILSATSQVVSGVSYDIKAQVTDCQGDFNCKDVPEICDMNIWYRPWLNSRIITVKFGGGTYSIDDLKTNGRSKREALVGGWSQNENDNPKVKEHLGNLLTKLDAQSGTGNKLKIKKILSVSTQVVAGTNWRIKALVSRSDCDKSNEEKAVNCGEDKDAFQTECNFKFWEKLPDENKVRNLDNIEIECDNPKLNYRSKRDTHVRKRRQMLVGGHSSLPNDDPRITKHLSHLLSKLDAQSGKDHKLKIKNIISATSQVVAGTNWNIKASVLLSDCKKSDEKSPENCGENEKSYETVCEFKFWEKLPDANGLRTLDNVRINCEDSSLSLRNKREIKRVTQLNGESEVNVFGGQRVGNEDELEDFISESLRYMDKMSSHENKFKIKEILSSTKQLVSGHLWRIKAVIVLSDCNKNDPTEWSRCGELQGAESKYCLIKVWNRPWIANGRETNITCDNPEDVYYFKSGKSTKLDSSDVNHNSSHYVAFLKFEKAHNKIYSSSLERIRRYFIFRDNMRYVELLNKHEQGTAVYGPTKFADLTREEFSKGLGYRSGLRSENDLSFTQAEIPNVELPDSFDWRDKGAVAKVKDQGSCGSCWAFSVTGNVEGQYAIKNGKLLEFSEQELVDCDKEDQGCNGGLMDNAYRQIEKLGGLEEEKDYPYDARDETCHLNKTLIRVELADAVNISQDETQMAKWLVKNGPISIAINANAMQFYMGGVSHPWKLLCNPKSLDHGVLIVGYGVHTYPKFKKALPYWIVKNSWGTSWGEQGYYRVYRGDGTCGVNQTPSSAILK